jgi:hypothetical protein
MHKNTTKCNETLSKCCKNKHGASKIIDTFETYQSSCPHQGLKPMVESYYDADGHDLIDNMALPARKQFEGLESTT